MSRKAIRQVCFTEAEVIALAENLKRIAVAIKTTEPLIIDGRAVDVKKESKYYGRRERITAYRGLINSADYLIRKFLYQNGGKRPIMGWDFDNDVPATPDKVSIRLSPLKKLTLKGLDNLGE